MKTPIKEPVTFRFVDSNGRLCAESTQPRYVRRPFNKPAFIRNSDGTFQTLTTSRPAVIETRLRPGKAPAASLTRAARPNRTSGRRAA